MIVPRMLKVTMMTLISITKMCWVEIMSMNGVQHVEHKLHDDRNPHVEEDVNDNFEFFIWDRAYEDHLPKLAMS